MEFDVDTVLFSIGLIPENALTEEAEIEMDPKTRGPKVDESYQTSLPGVFACGNVLHVHDLVDFVSEEGSKAGVAAAKYIKEELEGGHAIETQANEGIGYIVPQIIHPGNVEQRIELMFRVRNQYRNVAVVIKKDGEEFRRLKKKTMQPAEMEKVILRRQDLEDINSSISLEIVEEAV